MNAAVERPLFPLGSVLFPGGRLPLNIFEPRYVAMTKACLRDDTPFGVVLIRAGFETGKPAIPWDIGCTSRITHCDTPAPDRFQLVSRGETRFRILDRHTREDGLLIGRIAPLEAPAPRALPPRYAWLGTLLQRLAGGAEADAAANGAHFDDAIWVAYRLAERLPVTPERKQRLLACEPGDALLEAVAEQLRALDIGPHA